MADHRSQIRQGRQLQHLRQIGDRHAWPRRPERAFLPLGIAVITVSDTRSLAEDRSGDTLAERLSGAGHTLAGRALVPDDRTAIARP